MNNNKEPISKLSEAYRKIGPYLNIGITMASFILAGLAIGYLVDSRLNTKPLFIVIGSILGTIYAFLDFFRTIKNLEKRNQNQEKGES